MIKTKTLKIDPKLIAAAKQSLTPPAAPIALAPKQPQPKAAKEASPSKPQRSTAKSVLPPKALDQTQAQKALPGPLPKARIERAALTLFGAHGVDAVSMRQIASASRVSLGGLYQHFESKDQLAREMMVAVHGELAEMVKSIDDQSLTLSQTVHELISRYCAYADEDWPRFRYYLINLHRFNDLAAGAGASPMSATTQIAARAMQSREIPKGDPVLTASMALGVVMQAALGRSYGLLSAALGDIAPELEAAVLAVLLSQKGAAT